MQVIIPMSGAGDRFIRAGYTVPKPLIEIEGKPMIEHVVGLFPGKNDFIFICNRLHLETTGMRSVLERIAPGGRIVQMEQKKLGPVYAVLQAEKEIDDGMPTVVNYCDFSAEWDFEGFKRTVAKLKCDGCVTAYRGFHPHSLGSTHYAYMRVDGKNRMLEIREKEAFTKNRMEEYASAGTYYFSKGRYVKKYFRELMERGIAKNGEYYVSLAYNLMNEDGLFTYVYEIPRFLQWGTPEDLEEYCWWSGAFAMKAKKQATGLGKASKKLQLVLPMAGIGSRFSKEGYALPKPLIEVSGKPMFIQSLRDLPKAAKAVAVAQEKEVAGLKAAAKGARIGIRFVGIKGTTEGQACTVLLSEKLIDKDAPLFIAPCDTGYVWDAKKFGGIANDASVDCCIWAFGKYAPAARNPDAYGWLALEGEKVKAVSCKTPVSSSPIRDFGITGAFYFRKAGFFLEAAGAMIEKNRRVNGEFYVDEAINEVIRAGRRTVVFEVDRYLCWGSPNELRTYQYWQEYFNTSREHPYKKGNDEDFL